MILGRGTKDVIGGTPRVDLMPPEVAQRRADRRLQGWTLTALVVVAGLAVAGSIFAAFSNTIAQAGLIGAQAESQSLLAQQQEFSEVTKINSSIALADQARLASTASEVLWLDVQRDILAALPAGVTVTQLSVLADAPWTTTVTPATGLQSPRIATVGLSVTSATLAEISTYVRALEALEITADVTVDSTQFSTGYASTITLNLGEAALSKRFTEEYEPRAEAPVIVPDPAVTPTPEPSATPEEEE